MFYFYHPYSGEGGADLSISRLINGLDHKKYEIDFLSLNYPKIKKKIKHKINYKIIDSNRTLFSFNEINSHIEKDKNFEDEVGDFTHKDIISSLKAPSQDPRSEFKSIEFRDDIKSIEDLKQIGDLTGHRIVISFNMERYGLPSIEIYDDWRE